VNNLHDLLNLYHVPGVGPTRFRALLGAFQSAGAVFKASTGALAQIPGIDQRTAQAVKSYTDDGFAERQLTQLKKTGARLITCLDAEYPSNLKTIHDPPGILFVKGDLQPEDQFALAIVGSRKPSDYGILVTERLASTLASQGFCIISGMAVGVDTLAHKGALKAGGRTLAVLGSGLDVIYPPSNKKLYEQICNHGAVISEYPFGTKPDPGNFPQRNRVISGLSLGVVITEARKDSGSLITGNHALDQNREVYAIPGPITSKLSVGCHELIQSGAKLVQSIENITEELGSKIAPLMHKELEPATPPDLTPDEQAVIQTLKSEAQYIDVLSAQCNRASSETLGILLMLELKGLVKQLPGKQFMRI
jgi:DNA processing protein